MATKHSHNPTSTETIIFETNESPLMTSGSYEDVSGGNTVCEYDLGLIGQYLKDGINTPKSYAALLRCWNVARLHRATTRLTSRLRYQGERLPTESLFPKAGRSSWTEFHSNNRTFLRRPLTLQPLPPSRQHSTETSRIWAADTTAQRPGWFFQR